jgi:cytochrome b
MAHTVRIWDLPTRLFHWCLVIAIPGLLLTANIGGNAMVWHFRLGYCVLALLIFRLVWGFVGGRWSRFAAFACSPTRLLRYLRTGGAFEDSVGHSPLGALSVFALLGVLLAQVGTGLFSDDEIAFSGPLTRWVSASVVQQATRYHADIGQYFLLGLIGLHVLAILFYVLMRRQTLVRPMIDGDKRLPAAAPSARDDTVTRTAAGALLALCAAVSWWVSGLGAL